MVCREASRSREGDGRYGSTLAGFLQSKWVLPLYKFLVREFWDATRCLYS